MNRIGWARIVNTSSDQVGALIDELSNQDLSGIKRSDHSGDAIQLTDLLMVKELETARALSKAGKKGAQKRYRDHPDPIAYPMANPKPTPRDMDIGIGSGKESEEGRGGGAERDELDQRIAGWFKDSRCVLWSHRAHAEFRQLVEKSDWDTADKLMGEAVRNRASIPTSYALAILSNRQIQEAGKPKMSSGADWKKKPYVPG
jgi:hypothetical protein